MLKPSSVRTCVIYEPQNGHIIHIHKEITMPGGLERTDAEIEARVRRFAAVSGRNIEKLRTAFVKDTRSREQHYKIDCATLDFVEVGALRER